jgi:hypothetical protein
MAGARTQAAAEKAAVIGILHSTSSDTNADCMRAHSVKRPRPLRAEAAGRDFASTVSPPQAGPFFETSLNSSKRPRNSAARKPGSVHTTPCSGGYRNGRQKLFLLVDVSPQFPSRKSYPRVAMMQPTQNRHSDNGPSRWTADAGDTYLSFSPFAVGAADVAPICPRQLAVQSASAVRQPFECTAYDMSLLSVGSSLMLQAISTSKQVTHLLSASEVGAHSRQEPLHC